MQQANRIPEALDAILKREQTEAAMLRNFGNHLGAQLNPKSLPLPSGGYLEIDGFSVSPAVLCQVHSEIGPLTDEQEQNAMFDILKLNYAASFLGNTSRRVLLVSGTLRQPLSASVFGARCGRSDRGLWNRSLRHCRQFFRAIRTSEITSSIERIRKSPIQLDDSRTLLPHTQL